MKDKIISFVRTKDYEMIVPDLGRGSFGKTVLLKDPIINELFVCKKYEPYYDDMKELFFDTFINEIKIMHKLHHRNIVRIFNYYLYPENHTGYILMEHIEGTHLGEFLSDLDFSLFYDINDIFLKLVDAFSYLEQNKIIHRDIRESNILITSQGEPILIDFGLGKVLKEADNVVDSRQSIINRNGMKKLPEEFDAGEYDSLTDMFCFAELLSRLMKQNKINTFKYSNILSRMMEINRSERYDSFNTVKEILNSKQMELLQVTENEKQIYRNFSNSILEILSVYTEYPVFEEDLEKVIVRLNEIITTNFLEEYIQRNDLLINIFVRSSYRYKTKVQIEFNIIKSFRDWFINISKENQKIVLTSIILKIGKIKIEHKTEIPF